MLKIKKFGLIEVTEECWLLDRTALNRTGLERTTLKWPISLLRSSSDVKMADLEPRFEYDVKMADLEARFEYDVKMADLEPRLEF